MNKILQKTTPLTIEDWQLTDYQLAFDRQTAMVHERLTEQRGDTLVFVEHPDSVTLGRRATASDLHFPESFFEKRGVELQRINRGGLATAHEPGQLVAYPIIRLKKKNLHWFADTFLNIVITLLAEYGVDGALKEGEPGVWVNNRKICSFGIALKKWVSCHGLALNVNNTLETFSMIVPCGHPDEVVTSLSRELGYHIDMDKLKLRFSELFCTAFDYQITSATKGE
jgi:lipoate-protein ligase B